MRHKKGYRKLNRTSEHRHAMFANMLVSLYTLEQIKTTLPKAKELRRLAEKFITMARKDDMHTARQIMAYLQDEVATEKVMKVLGPRYAKRPGGYTRVLKAGFRYGDMAPMAIIELVDRDMGAKAMALKANADKTLAKAEKPAKAKTEKAEKKADKPKIKAEKPKADLKAKSGKEAKGAKVSKEKPRNVKV